MPRTAPPDDVDAFVGARIGLRRTALGLSQSALALRVGVSFQQVQKYETGQNRISASRLHRVATVLGTSVEAFFPPVETAEADSGHSLQALRFITATSDGRTTAAAFPRIADRSVRQALARIVSALAGDR
ncbi:helix-turn-helix domain-containing protein [Brevundimonas lenta]|uniref:Transcriptional regulator with XRE-family HTH domain n=1 Tax=Brevundimonas lenta TaxID=424796 RepID=A0A7W6NN68_9CAUL|nr:helix-turn-helix transcriptional regulator [Brevundimonas lenta]MBB4081468.1 transcriptional regulator with XRE-family HTH domain [Brevundimonas lenta]